MTSNIEEFMRASARFLLERAMPRLIPVSEWAVEVFGEKHKPHANTLLRWIHDGRIRPQPKKVGCRYFVDPKAEYVEADADLLARTM